LISGIYHREEGEFTTREREEAEERKPKVERTKKEVEGPAQEGSQRSSIPLTGLFIERLGLVFDNGSDNSSKRTLCESKKII